ncbi:MAG: hypothetical protein ACI85I_001951 [Arenicella sp.]|jgi:hypothetical protein
MKIEEGIKALLREKGMAVVPSLGTFLISHVGASVQEQGGVIAPPAETIEFSEETNPSGKGSVTDYLYKSGYSAEQLEEDLGDFVNSVKSNTSSGGKSTVEGLGFFRANEAGGIEFFSEEEAQIASESFGLPKLTVRPLVPVVVNAVPAEPTSSSLLLKAILVPLVLIALILIFLVFKPDAYRSLAAYFTGSADDKELVDDKKDSELDDKKITLIEKDKERVDKEAGKETIEKDKLKEGDNKEEDKTEEKVEKPENNDRGATTGGIVSSKTNRFYIIIGSFTNDAAAKKAIAKANKIGYPGAKILKMSGRTRVSVDDYEAKSNAVGKAKRVGKDFPGAWVLAN